MSVVAGRLDLTGDFVVQQGATWTMTANWDEGGVTVDLSSGYTAQMQISKKPQSANASAEITSAAGEIVLSSSDPNISMTISDVKTQLLTFKKGWWNIEITETSTGIVTRLLEGDVEISPDTTKEA